MKHALPWLASIAIVLGVSGCAHVPPAQLGAIRHAEALLATDGEYIDFQYHVLAEDRHASSLKFEGFLLAFEKSRRERIGFKTPWLHCSFWPSLEDRKAVFKDSRLEFKSGMAAEYPEWMNYACKRFDDRERVFLSHVVEFGFRDEPIRHLAPSVLFSMYPTDHHGADTVAGVLSCEELPATGFADGRRCTGTDSLYDKGWDYLTRSFRKALEEKLAVGDRGTPYTHIVIASMGWNTAELETIQNYNSLIGNLLDAARPDAYRVLSDSKARPFKPLFIGLSWPSAWTFRTGAIASFMRTLSVVNKGYDADELGLSWYGALINVAVREAVANATGDARPRPTIVTIGHSYGARALSHAVAACPFFDNLTVEACRKVPSADIVIGLQAAYNRSRFLPPRDDGSYPDGTVDFYIYRDGSPLQRYDVLLGHGTRHFYVWSSYDAATTRLNLIGGGDHVCRFAENHADRFTLVPCAQTVANAYGRARNAGTPSRAETIALDACSNASAYLDPVGRCKPATGPPTPGSFVTTSDRVLLIDGSGLVHHDTPLHGGGAHSDIYKWEIGTVIWQIIRDNSGTGRQRK